MSNFSQPLGDAIKRARIRQRLTQNEVAESINIDSRTILNIENYKGNPKMEILFPLIRKLRIDPQEIFYPELIDTTPAHSQIKLLIENCSEQEAEMLIPILESILTVLRNRNSTPIK